jgi:hypothetical protein
VAGVCFVGRLLFCDRQRPRSGKEFPEGFPARVPQPSRVHEARAVLLRHGKVWRFGRAIEAGESLFNNFVSGILLLGDSYFKQGNFADAIKKYGWIESAIS